MRAVYVRTGAGLRVHDLGTGVRVTEPAQRARCGLTTNLGLGPALAVLARLGAGWRWPDGLTSRVVASLLVEVRVALLADGAGGVKVRPAAGEAAAIAAATRRLAAAGEQVVFTDGHVAPKRDADAVAEGFRCAKGPARAAVALVLDLPHRRAIGPLRWCSDTMDTSGQAVEESAGTQTWSSRSPLGAVVKEGARMRRM